MTDKEALQVLESLKLTVGRGSGKTKFQGLVLEAMAHATIALKEKVEKG